MRVSLPRELRKRFDIAWSLLPESVQDELRYQTRSVRFVESLAGASVRCADGSRMKLVDEGAAWYGCETTGGERRGFLLISRELAEGPEDFFIATVLHELAHGLNYANHDFLATLVPDHASEVSAWLQAAAWAAFGANERPDAKEITTICLHLGHHELIQWYLDGSKKLKAGQL